MYVCLCKGLAEVSMWTYFSNLGMGVNLACVTPPTAYYRQSVDSAANFALDNSGFAKRPQGPMRYTLAQLLTVVGPQLLFTCLSPIKSLSIAEMYESCSSVWCLFYWLVIQDISSVSIEARTFILQNLHNELIYVGYILFRM